MINSIDEIISSIRKGEMVIIMDDENRENEGDLVMASQFIRHQILILWHLKDVDLYADFNRIKCKDLDLPLLKQSGANLQKKPISQFLLMQ